MRDLGWSPADEDADHVEAQEVKIGGSLGQVLLGREADGVLFSGRYGLQGGAVGGAAAKLHLDDHECVFVARDQVELPAAGAVVALDDLVAFTGEVAARYLLAEISGGPVVRAPTPA